MQRSLQRHLIPRTRRYLQRHLQRLQRLPRHQTPDTSHQTPEKKKRETRKGATSLPPNFGVSEQVRKWAAEKGLNHIDDQLEAFLLYARRKGATYTDWDAALMTAIREDWAKKRTSATGALSFNEQDLMATKKRVYEMTGGLLNEPRTSRAEAVRHEGTSPVVIDLDAEFQAFPRLGGSGR